MRNYMNILCTILFYVCSSHAQTPLNDISGTNTIYSASEVDYRLASKVPTNRTITVDGQVGSLESNLVFVSTDTGVTESTVTNIAQAVVTSNVPTLAQVASSSDAGGNSITNIGSIKFKGNIESLVYARPTDSNVLSATSFGNIQLGALGSIGDDPARIELRPYAYGNIIAGYVSGSSIIDWSNSGVLQLGYNLGDRFIGSGSGGSIQAGFVGSHEDDDENIVRSWQSIGSSSPGSFQIGENHGTMVIGDSAPGAIQIMFTEVGASATNSGAGSLQLGYLSTGQHAMTTAGGVGSLLLGAGTVSNKNSIVAGDGECSHGDGSITAGGGFFGSGVGITGITPNQIGALPTSHNTDITAHLDMRSAISNIDAKVYALPAQPSISLYNYFSTNANSTLVISASNSILRVQEVIP